VSREEHLAWCKARAHEYLDRGDIKNGVTSMLSDMGKRDDTKVNPTLALFGMKVIIDQDMIEAVRFVDGFN
jgi:hypothetical protein